MDYLAEDRIVADRIIVQAEYVQYMCRFRLDE